MIKFKKVHVRHLLGIDDCEYTPGRSLTVFEGPNEAGKTSHIRSLLALMGERKGVRPLTIAAGYDEGSLFIETTDGETFDKVYARGKKPRLTVRDSNGKRIPGPPQEYIDSLIQAVSTNPIRFANEATPKKERLAILLSAMSIEVTAQELATAAGQQIDVLTLEGWLEDTTNPLAVVDKAQKQLFDRRRDVNRDVKSKTAHVQELEDTLPAHTDESVIAELAELREDSGSLAEEKETRRTTVLDEWRKGVAQIDERILAETNRANTEKAGIEAEAGKKLEAIEVDVSALSTELTTREAVLEEQVLQCQRAIQTKVYIATSKKALDESEALSAELTSCLETISELKKGKLSGLPIEGLEIQGDDILIDLPERGVVAFEDLNFAKRVEIGVLVATMGSGSGPVCIDGIESLDAANTQALEDLVDSSGLQFFATRLTPKGSLKIRTRDAPRKNKKH